MLTNETGISEECGPFIGDVQAEASGYLLEKYGESDWHSSA